MHPYGECEVHVGADFHQPLRFPGHYHDATTGLHCNRFRYYSPELGRYLESDPVGIQGGLNLYGYCADGNPLRDVDLRGLNKPCPGNCPQQATPEEGAGREGTADDGAPQRTTRQRSASPEALAEARAKVAEAQAIHADLPRSLQAKTVAANGGPHLSGYDTESQGTRTGFSSEGRDPRTNLAYEQQIGHQSPANASVDPRQTRRGTIVGAQGDGETLPGGAAATHAERQSVVGQNHAGTNDPIGVSREQCGDCRSQFRQHATSPDRPHYPAPVIVADPAHTRVYNADGTVDVYRPTSDGGHELVRTVPSSEAPSATIVNYEGIDW